MLALGPTHHEFRPDVHRFVQLVESRFPGVRGNTYRDHPWPGWDGVSVDFWAEGGRGDPLSREVASQLWRYIFRTSRKPALRHAILHHTLWTSFGGESFWAPNDHSGRLRHIHVTFWK